MRRKIMLMAALLCTVVQGIWAADRNYEYPTKTKPQFYSSYGGKSNVVVINTPAELAYITANFSEDSGFAVEDDDWSELNYYLNADLDMGTEYSWLPLGRESYYVTKYKGTFWGNGHTIRYKILDLDEENQGLFSTIHKDGKVYDVNVICDINSDKDYVGGIAGENYGLIDGCTVMANIRSDEDYVGGIAGFHHEAAIIQNCKVSGLINCEQSYEVGGIVGQYGTNDVADGKISNCWVSADVCTNYNGGESPTSVGGIVGSCGPANTIEYCCMTGNVKSPYSGPIGGIIAFIASHTTLNHVTMYGTITSPYEFKNAWIGMDVADMEPITHTLTNNHTADDLADDAALSAYLATVSENYALYRYAIKYPYAIMVKTVGPGTAQVSAGGELNVPGTRYNKEVTLTTSGIVKSVTITDDDGNNVSFGGNESSGYTFNMPKKNVTITVYFWADWPKQGEGTEDDPYIISSTEDWDGFANNVTLGRSYSNKYVKLTKDISVNSMAGSSDVNSFQGIFDGDGHTLTFNKSDFTEIYAAPFRYVGNASFRNLHVAGAISTTYQYAGGMVACIVNGSTVSIENCRSSMTINSSNHTNGGFVSRLGDNSTLTISGCAFDGSFEGTGHHSGGFVGYCQSGSSATFVNNIFTPDHINSDLTSCQTFSRGEDATITNCYYNVAFGTAQGTEASTPTSDPGNIGSLVKDYGLVKAYENAIFFDGKYCVAASETTIIEPGKEWDAVCWQTHTAQTEWMPLSAGSTTGHTLGSAGTTTYYYITQDLTFSNTTAGGSGLTVLGTVYLYIPEGKQITCTGANASGKTGGGAGVELTAGNTLNLIGSGTLNATGGNAANGGNGGNGSNATGYNGDWTETGTGGNGGYGGGGAGAGIGTRGGNGGNGGNGGSGYHYSDWTTHNGTNGTAGSVGATAGAMGTIYVYKVYQQTAAVTVNATGGAAGTSGGSGGSRGRGYAWDGLSYNYTVAGGAGGGGGGFGGAASNIGTGGPGGGGGGGGAGGAQDYKSNSTGGVYDVTAYGGKGGKNANGSSAADGTEAGTTGDAQNQGWVTVDNGEFTSSSWNPASGDVTFGNGGNGGGGGNVSNISIAQRVWGSLVLGSGTETDPYQIRSAADFEQLASNVNGGTTYENTYFELVNDISVETMVGTDDANSFQGTFDGDNHTLTFNKGTAESPFDEIYCAPFRHVKNAVIKNLHVTGTIYTSVQKAAGFVGESHSALTILGSRSSIAINSSKSGDGTHGGFVSTLSGSGNTIIIDGCVFDGSFATTASTTNCGGFVGWPVYNRPVFSNSLMKPSSVDAGMLINTFARRHEEYDPTIDNCYYMATTNLPTNQGTQAYAIATAPANLGEPTAYYDMVKVYGNVILFDGTYYVSPASITLANAADNSTTISDADGYLADVTLAGRTLYKDGAWNTLCLPFDVTLSGSILDGDNVEVLVLDNANSNLSGTTLTLNFTAAPATIPAGTPFIIKWDAAGEDIENPVFNGVIINAQNSTSVDFEGGQFVGSYSPFEITNANISEIVYLGENNIVGYSESPRTLRSCRAHFYLPTPSLGKRAMMRAVMNYHGVDGTTTVVYDILDNGDGSQPLLEGWYTIDGRQLEEEPTEKGIYLYNGIKVIIK